MFSFHNQIYLAWICVKAESILIHSFREFLRTARRWRSMINFSETIPYDFFTGFNLTFWSPPSIEFVIYLIFYPSLFSSTPLSLLFPSPKTCGESSEMFSFVSFQDVTSDACERDEPNRLGGTRHHQETLTLAYPTQEGLDNIYDSLAGRLSISNSEW